LNDTIGQIQEATYITLEVQDLNDTAGLQGPTVNFALSVKLFKWVKQRNNKSNRKA
jgi:hypothetical protein